jgi:hypothetical protein
MLEGGDESPPSNHGAAWRSYPVCPRRSHGPLVTTDLDYNHNREMVLYGLPTKSAAEMETKWPHSLSSERKTALPASANEAVSPILFGGPSGPRTPNLLIKSQLLYQLS